MSDLIRREDAARIAEDHNLDIWEYSTGNRSRIGHDPVAEAIRALPAVQPDADELVGHMTKLIAAGLDRIEQLTAERDRYRKALEETAQILSQCTFETIRVHGQYIDRREAVSRARAALKGETP